MYNLFLRNYGKKVRKVGKVRKSVKKLRVDCAVRLGWLQFITIDGYKFVNTGSSGTCFLSTKGSGGVMC